METVNDTTRQPSIESPLLQQGIAALRAGQKLRARELLLDLVDQDEQNEQGWLWLSATVDAPDDIRVCLENVLSINPQNLRAQQGIEWLDATYGRPAPGEPGAERALGTSDSPAARSAATVACAAQLAADADELSPSDVQTTACPFCGAPVPLSQQSCQSCGTSLMVRKEVDASPSQSLRALLAIALPATAAIAAAIALVWLVAAIYAAQRGAGPSPIAGVDSVWLVLQAVLLGLLAAALTWLRPLLRARSVPAYAGSIALAAVAAVVVLTALRQPIAPVIAAADPARDPNATAVAPLLALAPAAIVALGVLLLGCAALAALCYGDFIGRLVRFGSPLIKSGEPAAHYNRGLAYKNRGMWYMAVREWEIAANRAPRDINYLRALGLAYAQIKRYDAAQRTIERALAIAPGHTQLAADLALVKTMRRG